MAGIHEHVQAMIIDIRQRPGFTAVNNLFSPQTKKPTIGSWALELFGLLGSSGRAHGTHTHGTTPHPAGHRHGRGLHAHLFNTNASVSATRKMLNRNASPLDGNFLHSNGVYRRNTALSKAAPDA